MTICNLGTLKAAQRNLEASWLGYEPGLVSSRFRERPCLSKEAKTQCYLRASTWIHHISTHIYMKTHIHMYTAHTPMWGNTGKYCGRICQTEFCWSIWGPQWLPNHLDELILKEGRRFPWTNDNQLGYHIVKGMQRKKRGTALSLRESTDPCQQSFCNAGNKGKDPRMLQVACSRLWIYLGIISGGFWNGQKQSNF